MANPKTRRNSQSSTRNLLVDPDKLMAKRIMTAVVASRRLRTAVMTKAGLSEYGSTKFGVTPGGGARAGTYLGLVVAITLPVLALDKAVESHVQVNTRKEERQQNSYAALTGAILQDC